MQLSFGNQSPWRCQVRGCRVERALRINNWLEGSRLSITPSYFIFLTLGLLCDLKATLSFFGAQKVALLLMQADKGVLGITHKYQRSRRVLSRNGISCLLIKKNSPISDPTYHSIHSDKTQRSFAFHVTNIKRREKILLFCAF